VHEEITTYIFLTDFSNCLSPVGHDDGANIITSSKPGVVPAKQFYCYDIRW